MDARQDKVGQDRPEVVLIAGPTASGKSALALRLAERHGALIVNADSMQVYRDLRILTARPSQDDERLAPHALFGHVDGAATYSVSHWLGDVACALNQAKERGLIPILVGGTGLYFKALIDGLSPIPPVSDAIRAEVRAWAADLAPEALHRELGRRDPATAARLRPTDPQRLLRALEVHIATGESLAAFQATREPGLLARTRWDGISLQIDRGVLRERIDRRFDQMLKDGALDEIAALRSRGLDPALPVMRALGVPPLLKYVAGNIDLAAAVADAKAATKRYIKRQETFARHQLAGFHIIGTDEAESLICGRIQSL